MQFSCSSAFIEANVASWKKKNNSHDCKSTKDYLQWKRDHLFSFFPPSSPDIHSLWSLFKVAFTVSSSCNGGFCCVPLKEMCTIKILWGFTYQIFRPDSSNDGCVVYLLPLPEAMPPSYSASSPFYLSLGSCREGENGNAWSSDSQIRLKKKSRWKQKCWENQVFINCAVCWYSFSIKLFMKLAVQHDSKRKFRKSLWWRWSNRRKAGSRGESIRHYFLSSTVK